jgi:uncharacterized membrane protein YdcZ (DUF606 family)
MVLAIFLAVLVGISIVVQGSVNAQLLKQSNLWLLLTIGNVVCTLGTLGGYLATRARGSIWEELTRVPTRVLIPSLCGLAITAGMPLAIGRIGVFTAVVTVIAVQIVAGVAWDRLVADAPISAWRLAGAALVFGGSLLVMRG